jgi:hypothetical protein
MLKMLKRMVQLVAAILLMINALLKCIYCRTRKSVHESGKSSPLLDDHGLPFITV